MASKNVVLNEMLRVLSIWRATFFFLLDCLKGCNANYCVRYIRHAELLIISVHYDISIVYLVRSCMVTLNPFTSDLKVVKL